MSSRMRILRAEHEEAGRKEAPYRQQLIHAYALISYSKATMVWTLGSGHEDPGLSDATQRVHMIKLVGVLRQSHVYMIK